MKKKSDSSFGDGVLTGVVGTIGAAVVIYLVVGLIGAAVDIHDAAKRINEGRANSQTTYIYETSKEPLKAGDDIAVIGPCGNLVGGAWGSK